MASHPAPPSLVFLPSPVSTSNGGKRYVLSWIILGLRLVSCAAGISVSEAVAATYFAYFARLRRERGKRTKGHLLARRLPRRGFSRRVRDVCGDGEAGQEVILEPVMIADVRAGRVRRW